LARVATLKKQIIAKQPNSLFLFSGDTISPSVASRTFKGKQMIAAWNALGLDYATLGNHEFDFGPEVLVQRITDSKFKWICANITDKTTGKPFDNIDRYVIRNVGGVNVGIFGLITPDTLRSSHTGPNVDILDPCKTAQQLVPEMRAHGAQVIIALTHLTMFQDKQVARCVPLDLIVGGHEHVVLQSVSGGAPILKAGSDAVNLGRIDITYSDAAKKVESIDWQLLPVNNKIQDDPAVAAVVNEYEGQLKAELDVPVGETTVELDATQLSNQTEETNLGDFIGDAYRADNGAEIALFNGGSVRSNTKYAPGKLTRRDVLSILPFENPIVKLEVSGAVVRQALEHGVATVGTKAGGRFPQVSGMSFSYDARKPPGSRVSDVLVNGKPLDDSRNYTLTTNGYITTGGDGYTMFKNAKYLLNEEDGNSESVALLNAITKAKVISPQVQGRIKRIDVQP
jgi:5'-nucleotidase